MTRYTVPPPPPPRSSPSFVLLPASFSCNLPPATRHLDTPAPFPDSPFMALAEVPAAARAPFLSIVIPVFNEGDNLQPLIAGIEATLSGMRGPVEGVGVDDGSRDGSWPLIRSLTTTRPWLKAIRFL